MGWYVDDVVVTNAQELLNPVTNSIASTNFAFTAAQPGNYSFQARALIFTDFPLGWGPVKLVTAVTPPPIQILFSKPVLAGSQLRLDFTLQSGAPFSFKLLRSAQPSGGWSVDTGAALTTNVPGSTFRFTTTTNSARQYYRVQGS